ncbi:CYTH domain-containing protein [Myxacorys almedinensis]|uniref:CYTH domain-containing protein n=1 Tax=Myxacorys almedinensis A TaxID=2690445 RepID=A0A8J8CL65_9CYAN|nr:CYTH domain-containing protein [Myxacorys almedinensis]NDJ15782.1 CYTH domain-containing protein [Myxacorys almedinensis A]
MMEIERKFLISSDAWRTLATGTLYRQGYIPSTDGRTVRVRIVGQQGYLTIKGKTQGISRAEFEYPIPVDDATQLLDTICEPPLIEKYRYRIRLDSVLWEVDEFLGENQGLVIAEVELETETQAIALPSWVGQEVSGDLRYYNANLAKHPFQRWS